MSKTKVLQVIGNLNIGGAENVVMDYYRNIDREQFEFHYLVYTTESGDYEDEVYDLGGRVIHIDYSFSDIRSFYYSLISLYEKEKYDIVHSHTLFNSGIVLKAANKAGVPKRIAHSHSTKNKVKTNYILKIYEKIMRYTIKKNATDFLACSKSAGEYLYGNIFFESHGKKVLNGIETNKYEYNSNIRNQIREMYDIDENCIVLGHVGHLASVKNQKYLLKILKELNDKRYILMLIGDGEDKNQLKNHAKSLNMKEQVLFTGNIDNVNEYLNAIDIFLFPSLFEGLPLAVVEAQASGLPCIISRAVPTDVLITEHVKRLPIGERDIKKWVSFIKNAKFYERKKYAMEVNKAGYEVKKTGQQVEKIYKNR